MELLIVLVGCALAALVHEKATVPPEGAAEAEGAEVGTK